MNGKTSVGKLCLLLALSMGAGVAAPGDALAAGPAKSKSDSGGGGGYGYASAGTVEFGLKGLLDLDTGDNTAVYADLTLGYFLLNGVEAGFTVLEGTTPAGERDTVGVFGEYHYAGVLPRVTPYVGGALRHTAPPADEAEGPDGRIVAAYGGLCLPFTADAAVGVTAEEALADHSVLGTIGHRKRQERDVQLSLRLFL